MGYLLRGTETIPGRTLSGAGQTDQVASKRRKRDWTDLQLQLQLHTQKEPPNPISTILSCQSHRNSLCSPGRNISPCHVPCPPRCNNPVRPAQSSKRVHPRLPSRLQTSPAIDAHSHQPAIYQIYSELGMTSHATSIQ
jgi:hypothetical protein